jgi:ornithine decarboxylase
VDHLCFARENGIDFMTFDSIEELEKIKKHYPTAKIVIRIMVDDSKSLCKFNIKF